MLQTQHSLDVCELRCLEFRPFVSTLIMVLFRPFVCHCNKLGWVHVSGGWAPCHCPATLSPVKVCLFFALRFIAVVLQGTRVSCTYLMYFFFFAFRGVGIWLKINCLYFYRKWCRLTYVQLVLLKLLTSKRFTLQMNTDIRDGAVGASLIT